MNFATRSFSTSYLLKFLIGCFLFLGVVGFPQNFVSAQSQSPEPVLLGTIKDNYSIQKTLYKDDFKNLDNWVVQTQSTKGPKHRVEAKNSTLNAFSPAGITIWFKPKMKGPVAIVYQVKAPKRADTDAVMPRDINNFWHMSADSNDPDALLDKSEYTGNFGTYHGLHGYYASTGGRSNTSTRFRRYPRTSTHLVLKYRDNKDKYLITPDKVHTVQLVAADGTAQYIVDGKLVYEITYGDSVPLSNGKTVKYTRERFPPYTKGRFGFRQTNTHHIYDHFRVYRLKSK